MKLPPALALFPIAPDKPAVFGVTPDKTVKKFLTWLGTEVIVAEPYRERDGHSEVLACGAPPAMSIARLIPQYWPGERVEHLIVRPDCSQRVWTCGPLTLRQVSCVEDLLVELARRKPPLCVLEHHNIAIRAAMEEYLKLLDSTSDPQKRLAFQKKLDRSAFELLPELIRISPATRFAITSHERGSGISRNDRAKYVAFKEVVMIMGRPDSAPHKKQLFNLIRRLYPQTAQ